MINKLKEATTPLHEEIEKENLAARIMSHDITEEEYKLLLLQNYVVYTVMETALTKKLANYTGDKSQRLEKDLLNLNIDYSIVREYRDKFILTTKAEAMGAAYVVEGSSLGGMMIAKEIKNCDALSHIKSHHFFNGDRSNVKSWNSFSKTLKQEIFTPLEEIQAIDKAKETFIFFGEVFNTVKLPEITEL